MNRNFPMIVCLGCLVAAAPAMGQLTWSDTFVVQASNNGNGTVTEVVPPTPSATSGGFKVTGDVYLRADPENWAWYSLSVRREFTVGPVPVAVSPTYSHNFKLAVGGGTADAPLVAIDNIHFAVSDMTAGGILVLPVTYWDLNTFRQMGNGYQIVNETYDYMDPDWPNPQYVLSPGVSYELDLYAMLEVYPQPDGEPTAVGSLEYGGITAFDGFEANLNWVQVPEPAAVLLLLGGGIGLLARRRRRDA